MNRLQLLQQRLGLEPTGIIDEPTVSALDNEVNSSNLKSTPLFKQMSKDVPLLQRDNFARGLAGDIIVDSIHEEFEPMFKEGGVVEKYQKGNAIAKQTSAPAGKVKLTKAQIEEIAKDDPYAMKKFANSDSWRNIDPDTMFEIGSDYKFNVLGSDKTAAGTEVGMGVEQGQVRLTDLFTGENKASKGLGSLIQNKWSQMQEAGKANEQPAAPATGTDNPDRQLNLPEEGIVGDAARRERPAETPETTDPDKPGTNPKPTGTDKPGTRRLPDPNVMKTQAELNEQLSKAMSFYSLKMDPAKRAELEKLQQRLLTSSLRPDGTFDGIDGPGTKEVKAALTKFMVENPDLVKALPQLKYTETPSPATPQQPVPFETTTGNPITDGLNATLNAARRGELVNATEIPQRQKELSTKLLQEKDLILKQSGGLAAFATSRGLSMKEAETKALDMAAKQAGLSEADRKLALMGITLLGAGIGGTAAGVISTGTASTIPTLVSNAARTAATAGRNFVTQQAGRFAAQLPKVQDITAMRAEMIRQANLRALELARAAKAAKAAAKAAPAPSPTMKQGGEMKTLFSKYRQGGEVKKKV